MDLLHPPLIDTAKTSRLRMALNCVYRKLRFFLSRLTARPAATLVLIGPPGSGKTMLSQHIILIEAAEFKSHRYHALQPARNLLRKSLRLAIQQLKSLFYDNENSNIFSKEIDLVADAPMNDEPLLPALNASAALWNFVTAEQEFVGI